MALSQDSVLTFLLQRGGQVSNTELVSYFKSLINGGGGGDPAATRHNRDAFKRSVNSVAVVKHVDGVKFVVAKKRYRDFVAKGDEEDGGGGGGGDHRHQHHPQHHHQGLTREDSSRPRPGPDDLQNNNNLPYCSNLSVDGQKKSLKILNISGDHGCGGGGGGGAVFAVISVNSPPPNHDFKSETFRTPERPLPRQISKSLSQTAPGPNRCGPISERRNVLRTTSSQSCENVAELNGPPQRPPVTRPQSTAVRRTVDESVPLEPLAHEWLVKCGAGMWRHVHGLLLLDPQLVTRRDFMSGFTALHWAAKGGNGEMVRKIMDISKCQGSSSTTTTTTTTSSLVVDINSKSHGGYTPLHLATIHGHRDVMALLVQGYGARVNVRDNAGKKPYHYLRADRAGTGVAELEELLGGGRQWQRDLPTSRVHKMEGEEEEHHHHQQQQQQLPKGFNTLSKLFQPHTGHRKKHRPQPAPGPTLWEGF